MLHENHLVQTLDLGTFLMIDDHNVSVRSHFLPHREQIVSQLKIPDGY